MRPNPLAPLLGTLPSEPTHARPGMRWQCRTSG